MKEVIESKITDEDYSHSSLENTLFEDCTFENSLFNGTSIRNTNFRNCTFRNCRFMNVEFESVKLSGARFTECSLIGLQFDTFGFREISFHTMNSRLEACVFEEVDISGAELEESLLRECSFLACELEGASFAGSDLPGTVFEQNNLTRANFRRAQNYELNPQNNKITKAQFSTPEVLTLLKYLNISID